MFVSEHHQPFTTVVKYKLFYKYLKYSFENDQVTILGLTNIATKTPAPVPLGEGLPTGTGALVAIIILCVLICDVNI